MAWTDTSIPLVRAFINDFTNTYPDARLTTILVASAYVVVSEFDFESVYTVDIPDETVLPDPENDVDFVTLTSLKAAIIILFGELRNASNQSILIKDGPTTIDAQTRAKDIKAAYEEMLDMYNRARQQYTLGNSRGVQAILGPYTVNYIRGNNLR